MPLYKFYFTLKDDALGMRELFDREEFDVEVCAHVISGTLEYDIYDVRYDGHCMADSDDELIRAIGRRVKAAAIAELDAAGPLWGRVQRDLELSYSEERGWRRAS